MEISGIFEEWNTYALRKALVQRDVNLNAIERSSDSKIVAITGNKMLRQIKRSDVAGSEAGK